MWIPILYFSGFIYEVIFNYEKVSTFQCPISLTTCFVKTVFVPVKFFGSEEWYRCPGAGSGVLWGHCVMQCRGCPVPAPASSSSPTTGHCQALQPRWQRLGGRKWWTGEEQEGQKVVNTRSNTKVRGGGRWGGAPWWSRNLYCSLWRGQVYPGGLHHVEGTHNGAGKSVWRKGL